MSTIGSKLWSPYQRKFKFNCNSSFGDRLAVFGSHTFYNIYHGKNVIVSEYFLKSSRKSSYSVVSIESQCSSDDYFRPR